MDWKQWIEKNALFLVVGACVSTGGVVAGVMEYYSTQKIDIIRSQQSSETSELKTQLASIVRSVGHEEYLDVRKIVVQRNRIAPAPNSQYFDDAEFYARPASGDWTYSQTNEANLLQTLLATDISKESFLHKAGNMAPIHLWRRKSNLVVQGHSTFKILFPYVYVERISVQTFKETVGSFIEQDKTSPTSTEPSQRVRMNGGDPSLDTLFRGDIAGRLLTFFLIGQLMTDSEMPSELLNVQKLQNVVYLAVRHTLKNVKVQNVPYTHYYLDSEFVIVSDGPNVTVVVTLVPSPDPARSNEYFQYLSSWFNDLRVLVG